MVQNAKMAEWIIQASYILGLFYNPRNIVFMARTDVWFEASFLLDLPLFGNDLLDAADFLLHLVPFTTRGLDDGYDSRDVSLFPVYNTPYQDINKIFRGSASHG